MGFSKLKIPRVYEQCSKPFEAKTVTTRFCGVSCANKSGKERKKLEKQQKEKENLLQKYSNKISEVQTREFITVSEATVMFGISKDTIHRMIKKGLIGGANLGIRLTRVKRADLENLFSTIAVSYTHLDVYKRQSEHSSLKIKKKFLEFLILLLQDQMIQ